MKSLLDNNKKKMVKECITYYINTTGLSGDRFIQEVVQNGASSNIDSLPYNSWLAVKSFKFFQQQGISLADCLEFRNLKTQLKAEKKGMNVTSVWKKALGEFIKSSDVSRFELFELSDKNSELNYLGLEKEVSYLDNFTDEENFFNTFDFDMENQTLLNKLPQNIKRAIKYKLPIFINLNPYIEHSKNFELLYEEMKLYGFGSKKYLNNFYSSLFRIIKFCSEYDLNDVRLGIFFPLEMFNEDEMYMDFYNEFRKSFRFNSGVCFSPKSVGVKSKAELISYTLWDLKSDKNDKINKSVVLKELIQHTEDTIIEATSRLFRGKRDSLYDWEVNSIIHSGISEKIPKYSSIQTVSGEETERFANVLGYQANAKNLLRSYKRVGVYSVPVGECTEITRENIFKSVVSYSVRSCLGQDIKVPIYLSNPDVTIEGYQSWVADCVIYFIFNSTNMTKSYREKDLTLLNRMFPLKMSEISKFITDENIRNDMNVNGSDNLVFTQIIDSIFNSLSKPAVDLFSFCKRKIIDSLVDTVREDFGYKDSLVAWDASFYQIRQIDALFTQKEEETYRYLLSKLQATIQDGIYKYGFVSELKNE